MAEALRASAGTAPSGATLQLRHTGGAVSCCAWSDAREHLSVDYLPITELLWDRPPSALEVRLGAGGYTFTARPALRVLKLDPGQVRDLLAAGRPLPRPAALFVTGKTTLREMSELRTAFGDGDPVTVTEIAGVLT